MAFLTCLALVSASSCRRDTPIPSNNPTQTHPFANIKQFMDETNVVALLGLPDEIRVIDAEHLLDGVGYEGETYRWAYGVRSPGTFARIGVLSFSKFHQVLHHRSPTYRTHDATERHPLQCAASSNGLSCAVSDVTMTEARGETVRWWSAQVTLENGGEREYSRKTISDSIHRLSTIEVYDEHKLLIYSDDHRLYSSAFFPNAVFSLRAGGRRAEAVNFSPDGSFGPLPPGRYFVRVCFPYTNTAFISSNFSEFIVPEFPRESEYWERFRTRASTPTNQSALRTN